MVTNKKKGRPTEEPKNIQTRIRMTEKQSEKLKYCSEVLNVSKTDVLIKGLDEVYKKLPK